MTTDKLKLAAKLYRAYAVIFAACALLGVMSYWLFKGHAGSEKVNGALSGIKQTAEVNERRVENIIDAAKQKEEEAHHETIEKMAAVSDDLLPELLSGLLSEWRKQSGR